LAEPIVVSLLGDRWREAVDVLRVLAVNGVLTVFLSTAHHLNLATGMLRSTSMVLAAHAGITIPLMLWPIPTRGSYGATLYAGVVFLIWYKQKNGFCGRLVFGKGSLLASREAPSRPPPPKANR
jgi:O-antigen/teichoic acid export membrane protein